MNQRIWISIIFDYGYTSFEQIITTTNEDHYEIACNNKVRIDWTVFKKDKQKIVWMSYFYFFKQTEQSGSNLEFSGRIWVQKRKFLSVKLRLYSYPSI